MRIALALTAAAILIGTCSSSSASAATIPQKVCLPVAPQTFCIVFLGAQSGQVQTNPSEPTTEPSPAP